MSSFASSASASTSGSQINLVQNLVDPAVLDSGISYSEMRNIQGTAGKTVFVQFNHQAFTVQFPEMEVPFGYNDGLKFAEKDESGNPKGPAKYTLDVSFKGHQTNEHVRNAFTFATNLENKIKRDAIQNSVSWLKMKNAVPEMVNAVFAPLVKYSIDKETLDRNEKYDPTLRFKIPSKNGEITCEVYDSSRNLITENILSYFNKKCLVRIIAQCAGLWFAGGKFGMTWKIMKVQVKPKQEITGFAFISDGSEGAEEIVVEDEIMEDDGY